MSRPREIYISADIETDGPIPGAFSMLSMAFVAVASFDGESFHRLDAGVHRRYWELRPISKSFESEALAVNGLDREKLRSGGLDPTTVMREAARWVEDVAGDDRAVLVAYPAVFDWSFVHWYFLTYLGASPFGRGTCIDIRSLYVGATGSTYAESAKDSLPQELRPRSEHTHNALDDAVEQGELFSNLFELAIGRRPSHSPS